MRNRLRTPVVTDWEKFTPVFNSATSVATSGAAWRLVGDTIHIRGFATFNGAGDASAWSLDLPKGLRIDEVKLPSGTSCINDGGQGFGLFTWSDSGTNYRTGSINYVNSLGVGSTLDSSTSLFETTLIANADAITFDFTLPIANWRATRTI